MKKQDWIDLLEEIIESGEIDETECNMAQCHSSKWDQCACCEVRNTMHTIEGPEDDILNKLGCEFHMCVIHINPLFLPDNNKLRAAKALDILHKIYERDSSLREQEETGLL